MQELRFVRGDEGTLVVASDSGDQFRVVVDEALLAEVKRLSRRPREGAKVRPREIQSLVRAGKSREEISALTGAEPGDIERFEGPVLAERAFILESAHRVPVLSRGAETSEEPETFGDVIGERLLALGADTYDWSSWRDDEDGWLIGLEFISHDVAHRATWSFEHRKGVLTPLNDDAVRLSKQGEIGDRLIPKLRAVEVPERVERFDSGAFDPSELPSRIGGHAETAVESPEEPAPEAALPDEPEDVEGEYRRRQHIDSRAVTRSEEPRDFGETADLLDALRRRRGERELPAEPGDAAPVGAETPDDNVTQELTPADLGEAPVPEDDGTLLFVAEPEPRPLFTAVPAPQPAPEAERPAAEPKAEPERAPKKRRAEIPSWDDILFGTRSEEDPV